MERKKEFESKLLNSNRTLNLIDESINKNLDIKYVPKLKRFIVKSKLKNSSSIKKSPNSEEKKNFELKNLIKNIMKTTKIEKYVELKNEILEGNVSALKSLISSLNKDKIANSFTKKMLNNEKDAFNFKNFHNEKIKGEKEEKQIINIHMKKFREGRIVQKKNNFSKEIQESIQKKFSEKNRNELMIF